MAREEPDRDDADVAFTTVAVVGGGLIGGSFALASGVVPGVERVVVTDRDPRVRARLRELGIGTVVVDSASEAVSGADLVVLAIPVDEIARTLETLSSSIDMQAIVTDVGSLKHQPLLEVEAILAGIRGGPGLLERFVPGHPMAGSERSGPEAADGTIFQGATWVLTPHEVLDDAAFNRLSTHLRALGARVLAVSPRMHDELVAVTSQLPQLLASTLMDEAAEVARTVGAAALSITGGGFRDMTRIAGSEPSLWAGILAGNRDAVLWALDGYLRRLEGLRQAIEDHDWAAVEARLVQAQAAHRRLPSKARADELVVVVVPLADRPGMLASVTTALGEAGVNIEDLSMRHASAGDRGALVVAVDGRRTAQRAASLLEERGIACHLEGQEPT